MQNPRIGMIGLGLMGLGIATNIVKKGFEALYSFTTLKTVTIKHG